MAAGAARGRSRGGVQSGAAPDGDIKLFVMKNSPGIFLILVSLCAAAAPAAAQSATRCFRADWLQGGRVVRLNIDGEKVTGTFTVEGDADGRGARTYEFTGSLRGDKLTVAFAGGRRPDVSPSEMKSLVWTLSKDGRRELLRIEFRGKNYQTNRYEDRPADFEPCEGADYESLAKGAQTVRFDKGANSKRISLRSRAEFQAMRAPAAFLINVAKSQSLEITAEGCSIQVYLPSKKLYEFVEWEGGGGEKTFAGSQLDRLRIEALPVTGTYLVVLRKPAENMLPEAVTFKATNPGAK